jgi:hypothetical protein
VSYYALFKGWLLLSQPPGCLNTPTSFPTKRTFGDLSWGSGLFPSRPRNSSPVVRLPRPCLSIQSLVGFGNREAPSPSSALPPRQSRVTLALKLFRGEQAISKFVWHITPTHSSSLNFVTLKGSALHDGLASLQPGHG